MKKVYAFRKTCQRVIRNSREIDKLTTRGNYRFSCQYPDNIVTPAYLHVTRLGNKQTASVIELALNVNANRSCPNADLGRPFYSSSSWSTSPNCQMSRLTEVGIDLVVSLHRLKPLVIGRLDKLSIIRSAWTTQRLTATGWSTFARPAGRPTLDTGRLSFARHWRLNLRVLMS